MDNIGHMLQELSDLEIDNCKELECDSDLNVENNIFDSDSELMANKSRKFLYYICIINYSFLSFINNIYSKNKIINCVV